MSISTILICGAGTMGSGIALVAARSGYNTLLFDLQQPVLDLAQKQQRAFLEGQVQKGKITEAEMMATIGRVRFISDIQEGKADLVIEAIVERIDVKISLFKQLAAINPATTILASNTSSLSVSAIAKEIPHPERVAGLHFFNPAPLMKLVEIVKADSTSDAVIQSLTEVTQRMQKTGVICKDAPGFIVNRVARHFYLEALYLAEKGYADFSQIDEALEAAGFKMGPFRLMDLIGNDINFAVTSSLYEACNHATRFRPSPIQAAKVNAGELGRKTGKGYYNY